MTCEMVRMRSVKALSTEGLEIRAECNDEEVTDRNTKALPHRSRCMALFKQRGSDGLIHCTTNSRCLYSTERNVNMVRWCVGLSTSVYVCGACLHA